MNDFSNKTVLIVDDSRMSRMMIRTIILGLRSGWNVLEANCGEDALKVVSMLPVDYISLDVNMPGIDGFELARMLKETHPTIRVCLLTANVQESSRQQADALGTGFVKKPINEFAIAQAIDFFEQS
jgi:CheY-like chemotaxis protein